MTRPPAWPQTERCVYAIGSKPNYYDTVAQYAANGVTSLAAALQAKPLKTTVDSVKVALAYGAAAQVLPGVLCGSDVGFNLTGNVLYGTTPVSTYSLLACLSGDSGPNTTGNFLTDLGSSTATIAHGHHRWRQRIYRQPPECGLHRRWHGHLQDPGALGRRGTDLRGIGDHQVGNDTDGDELLGPASIKVTIASATTPCPQTGGIPNSGDPAACLAPERTVCLTPSARSPTTTTPTASFATSGLTDLQAALQAKPLKTTVGGINVSLAYGAAAEVLPGDVCGSDVGLHLTGNMLYGTIPVGTYTDNVCLSGDTGTGTSGNFLTDLGSSTATIATATVGGASLLNVTFNP